MSDNKGNRGAVWLGLVLSAMIILAQLIGQWISVKVSVADVYTRSDVNGFLRGFGEKLGSTSERLSRVETKLEDVVVNVQKLDGKVDQLLVRARR